MTRDGIFALAIIAGGLLVLRNGAGALGLPGISGRMTAEEVFRLADEIRWRYYPSVDPVMLTAMAKIESDFRPSAFRSEPHVGANGDASIGLMQTLFTTAKWLHDSLGYQVYMVGSPDTLFDPQTSIYFGGAYVDWLSRWRGVPRSERFIVESYNGGPGNSNTQTRRHYDRYVTAKASLQAQGIGAAFEDDF